MNCNMLIKKFVIYSLMIIVRRKKDDCACSSYFSNVIPKVAVISKIMMSTDKLIVMIS